MTKRTALLLTMALAATPPAAASTIKQVRLELGHIPMNTIGAPLFKSDGVPYLKVAFTRAYGSKVKIMRGFGGLFTKGPSYDLAESIDLAALFGQAVKSEAKAMGFRVADSGDKAFEVTGSLRDIYFESQQMTGYGAMLSYGYMLLELQMKGPGKAATRTWKFHSFFGKVPGGFSRKDEAEAALANLLVEGAQELITRLNHDFLKAPALPVVDQKLRAVVGSGVKGHEGDLHVVGLAAGASAVAPLLERLPREESEDERSKIVNALARIGSAAAVAPLSARYDKEDEDCRWYTLKAMDYIGNEAALALVRDKGVKDGHEPCKRLAKKMIG